MSNKPDYGLAGANIKGVIDSLNAKRIQNYQAAKEYPANVAGMVAAILDLNWGQSSTGPQPPTYIQANDSFSPAPSEGALWFDTRQGRLMVYAHGDWYQTNGGDGYAIVQSNNPPSEPITGQFWLDFLTKNLYIFDGFEFLPVKSEDVVLKDVLKNTLQNSATYADFKTNMLALL